MRVLLLGTMANTKGGQILQACARRSTGQNMPLEFHVMGAAKLAPTEGTTVYGAYEVSGLPTALERIRPHLAWFPAQCPESYSYTLSEAMHAGLPILASALGSLPERLAGRAWSWLHPWDASPESWLECLLKIRTRHLVGTEPAQAPGQPPRWDVDFYPDRYLAGIRSSGTGHALALDSGKTRA